MPILFCNIAWMKNYAGRSDTDKPLGGGGFVRDEGWCGEECNFAPGDDGYVYGHFETLQGETDRRVMLETLGAPRNADYLDGVDVVWTAPDHGDGARVVVGWYRDARVYRRRQRFEGNHPSARHEGDEIESFMTRARTDNARLLKPDKRTLTLGRGVGWSGQTSWWYADQTTNPDARRFVESVKAMIDRGTSAALPAAVANPPAPRDRRTGAAPSLGYVKYLREHEIAIGPLHHQLEERFRAYLRRRFRDVTFPACHRDDLRYCVAGSVPVMVEIKPAAPAELRFAIRTAIGQLLDYRQHQRWAGRQLVLVGTEVRNADDRALALENGFGLAWPDDARTFTIVWPNDPARR